MVLGLRLLGGFEIYVAFWVSLEIMFIIIITTTLLTCRSVNAINHQELVIKSKQTFPYFFPVQYFLEFNLLRNK